MVSDLREDTYHVPKRRYCLPGGRHPVLEIGDFVVSMKPVTNDIVVLILNELGLKNTEGGTYHIINECNPSIPLRWDGIASQYKVVQEALENHPVCGISWEGARLVASLVAARLPFEAEWEVCATSGDPGRTFPWGNAPPSDKLANYGEFVGATSPVASYPPNAWGLYDMAGNVEEWCLDWFYPGHPYSSHLRAPPELTNLRSEKTVKGGCWNKGERLLRCSSRRGKWNRIGTVGIGFRLVWDSRDIEPLGDTVFV